MAVRKLTKSSNGTKAWESMSSSVKRRPQQEWCAFYTPMGRMVSQNLQEDDLGTCIQKIGVQIKQHLRVKL